MGSKYLMIENRGVASVDLLTIVGASTARGQSEMIGQFGSGFKYSLAALLRESRNVFLYIGKDGYEFGVDERGTKGVDDKDFAIREVVMKQVAGSSRRKKPMGFDVSFGEIDWKDPWLPVREFISNAADASQALNGNYKDVKVELVEEGQVRAKDGYTRVFIQADSAIRGCYDQVPERFLIFRPTFKADTTTIIPKRSNGDKVLIYRKGVLVGEFPYPSLFNYNLNDIELKESRVISESNARDACGTAIRNADTASLVEFLQAVRDHIDLWETTHAGKYEMQLHSWEREYEFNKQHRVRWAAAIEEVFGDTGVACDNEFFVDPIRRKGYQPVMMDTEMMNVVTSWGMKSSKDVLDRFEVNGRTKIDLTETQASAARDIWDCLVEIGCTQDKPMPPIVGFHDVMTAGTNTGGYYADGHVGISKDILDTGLGFEYIKVLIEEFTHYITGSRDMTRDFQDAAFRIAGKLMQRQLNWA